MESLLIILLFVLIALNLAVILFLIKRKPEQKDENDKAEKEPPDFDWI